MGKDARIKKLRKAMRTWDTAALEVIEPKLGGTQLHRAARVILKRNPQFGLDPGAAIEKPPTIPKDLLDL